MNERIWELKRQAMLFAQEKCDGQTTDMHGNLRSNIWTEKFAELIVRECADYCKGHILPKDVAEQNGLTYNDGVGDCAIGLEQHFGVEE